MPHPQRPLALVLLAVVLCSCSSASPKSPTPAAAPPTNGIALVFETGADAGNTAQILDTLHREGVRATFSVTGLWAEQNRDLLLAIAAAGHQIINDGYHSTSFTGVSTGTPPLSAEDRALELSRTKVTVYHLTGRSTRPYWRPPYNDVDDTARQDAAVAGYSIAIMSTADTATTPGTPADAIVGRTLAAATPGAIFILHAGSDTQDAAALPRIIAAVRANGLAFAAIEDILPH